MNIKLKYRAWVGEKHPDIAHKLTDSDIETFATEFSEHLLKNCSVSNIVSHSEQLKVFVNGFYEWHDKQGYVSVKMKDWDDYIATLL